MKIRITIILILVFSIGVKSQEKLNDIRIELKENGKISKSISVSNSSKDDNKESKVTERFYINKDHEDLFNKILVAFEEEKENASTVTEHASGEDISKSYVFKSEHGEYNYSITTDDKKVRVFLYSSDEKGNKEKKYYASFSVNDGTHVSVKKMGKKEDISETVKPKFFIPKEGYIFINGEKLTAEQAREKGFDVNTIPDESL